MEQENNSGITKSTMTSGAILGAALIILTLILGIINLDAAKSLGSIMMIVGIVLAIKHFRNNVLHGYISYGQALGFGVLTAFFASVIIAFFTFLTYNLNPALLDKGLEIAKMQLLEKKLPDDQMEMGMKLIQMMVTPPIIALCTMLLMTFIGFIFSLIIAAFMKKEKNIFTPTPTETN
jgi:hypothetical protein